MKKTWLLALGLLLSGCENHAGATPDLSTMLINLSNSYPSLWRLATATAYVMGFMFAMKAVYALKSYGDARTMMSSSTSIKGPLLYFLVASALIYIPTAFDTLMFTAFQTTTVMSYTPGSGNLSGLTYAGTRAVVGLIQFVGLCAFIRGWLYLARGGDHSGQPVVGKALTHIVGGILAINIVGTQRVLFNTLGIG